MGISIFEPLQDRSVTHASVRIFDMPDHVHSLRGAGVLQNLDRRVARQLHQKGINLVREALKTNANRYDLGLWSVVDNKFGIFFLL